MSWHPGIPEETNQVRSASGDLIYMKENFDLLSGVATKGISGISGVSADGPSVDDTITWDGSNWIASGLERDIDWLTNVDTSGVVSGQSLVYNGTTWVDATPVAALNDLTDVATAGAVSGNALVYDGSSWGPGTINAVSGTPGNGVALLLTGTVVISGTNVDVQVPFDSVAFNPESWTVDTTSGVITVPSGVSFIDIHTQTKWPATAPALLHRTQIKLDGVSLSGLAGYGIEPAQTSRSSADDGISIQTLALSVPVSGGELITVDAATVDDGSTPFTLSGTPRTFLLVRESAGAGAGGGGGSGFADPVKVFMVDAPPTDANDMDDEFDYEVGDGGGPGGLDSRWATWDPGSVITPSLISGANICSIDFATETRWGGIYQAISGVGTPVSGQNWTVFAKVSWTMRQGTSDDASFGFFSMEDPAGDPGGTEFTGIWIDVPGTVPPDIDIGVGLFSDRTDTVPPLTSSETMIIDDLTNGVYLRIRHQDTNRHNFEWSTDGIGWRSFQNSVIPSWNPTAIGFAGIKAAGSNTLLQVHWVRMVSGSPGGRAAIAPGAKVQLERL